MSFVRRFEPVLVFLIALIWFSVFQPWGSFTDPDGFYHAQISARIGQDGPIQQFPWLDLTTLGQHFADQHFLYHVALIPFIKLFGTLPGTQVATVLFAASFVFIFYLVLRKLKTPWPWLWCIPLVLLPHVLMRLTWAKASPFALAFFMLGLLALMQRRYVFAFVVGVLYALSHGGWIILLACSVLYLIGEWLAQRFAFDEKKYDSLFTGIKTALAGVIGVACGLLLHPNRSEILPFLWTQVFQVGVTTPVGRVFMGMEWYPAGLSDAYALLLLPTFMFGALLFALIVSPRKPLDRMVAAQVVASLTVFAGLLALTLKSLRFVEYAGPVGILVLALLASLIDWKRLPSILKELIPEYASVVLAGCLIFLVSWQLTDAFRLIRDGAQRFDHYDKPMAALKAEAKPGDRIYHSDWDIFPDLFAVGDEFRYVSGLDPTFLLSANPELSDATIELYQGRATSTAFSVIHDRVGASFIVVDRKNDAPFERVIRAEPRFVEFYQDEDTSVFRVSP